MQLAAACTTALATQEPVGRVHCRTLHLPLTLRMLLLPTPQVFYLSSLGIFIVSLDFTYYRAGPKTNEASGGGIEQYNRRAEPPAWVP